MFLINVFDTPTLIDIFQLKKTNLYQVLLHL